MSNYLKSNAQLNERRESSRIAIRMGASAIVSNSDSAIECTILDISQTGAKLELKGVNIIPSRLMLYVPEVDCTYTCEVVWRDGKHIGLKFVNSETF